jgi:glycosyltransferase involved in cell wall biosynthesis
MGAAPKISVIMLVYNAAAFIRESVSSILEQSCGDFELIIIDDHSTDGTFDYLQSLTDPRIRLQGKTENRGLVHSLILGFGMVRGEYIARMDGDDISEKTRFEKQLAFMEAHPEVVCCGCNYIEIPSGKKSQLPLSDEEIRVGLFSSSQFAHPTVMIRAATVRKHHLAYDPEWELAEDYKLWTDLSLHGKLANLPEPLLRYRVHEQQYSSFRAKQQQEKAREISLHYTRLISGGHPHAPLFATGILSSRAELRQYMDVEEKIASGLMASGTKNVRTALLKRRAAVLRRSLLLLPPRSANALKLLISSATFLGLKFYISWAMGREKKLQGR